MLAHRITRRITGLFVLFCICFPGLSYAAEQIHFTITGQTSVTFDWVGDVNTIYYGTSPSDVNNNSVVAGGPSPAGSLPVTSPWVSNPGPFREAKLTGLTENTLYYYKIGDSGTVHTFKTPLPRGSSGFTVCVTSDMQNNSVGNPTDGVFSMIAAVAPNFVLTCGDTTGANAAGKQPGYVDHRFNQAMVWSQDAPWMPAWGNHDWDVDTYDDLRDYKGRFDFPNPQETAGAPAISCCGEDWYWFDYGNVRFISAPEPYGGSATTNAWKIQVTPVFAAAQDDPNIKFIVVFGHRPAYSSGHHTADATGSVAIASNSLADTYSKFKLRLNGHSHNYERTDPNLTHGVIYVTDQSCGSFENGGACPGGWEICPQPSWSAYRQFHIGILKLDFSDSAIQGTFYCGPSLSGETVTCTYDPAHPLTNVLDTFTIGAVPDDNTPPTPNPMTWSSVPASTSSTTVTMTATTATDTSGVEYFFRNVTISDHNSGWQDSTSWVDTGLEPNTTYTYQVKARDKSSNHNETAYSATADVNTPVADTAQEIHFTIISNTAVTFDWVGTASHVHYGMSSGNLTSVAAAVDSSILPVSSPWVSASSGPFREAKLTGLTQNMTYYYKVGDDGIQHTFKTPLAPGSSGFDVVSVSDLHYSGANMTSIMNDIAAVSPTVVIIPGDITGAKNTGQENVDIRFNDFMAWSQEAALMPAWGNHEWDTPANDDLRNYKERFDLPNQQTTPSSPAVSCCGEDWSWFDYGNVRFITYPEPWSGAWADWAPKAASIMSDAQANPNISFIITYGHRPAYNSRGGDTNLQGYLDGLGDQFSKYVLNFCGHSHHYERSYPQHGVIHVIDGAATGNGSTGDCEAVYITCPPPAWSAFRALRWGFVKLHITGTEIEGSYIAGPLGGGTNDYLGPEGSVVDAFTIGADDNTPPTPDPMTWASAPSSAGPTSITMTASTASDVSGVEYYFNNVTDPNHDSNWQNSSAYTDTGLTTGLSYTYEVKARDKSGNHNETAYSTTASAIPVAAGAGVFTTTWGGPNVPPTITPANGDILSDYTGTNLANEAITASTATPSLSKKVAQTFTVGSSAITMDKFAFQTRTNTPTVVEIADGQELKISLYRMTGPSEYLQDFNAPSRPKTGTLLTTWSSNLPTNINTSHADGAKQACWLTFDLDNYALDANTTYALSFEFTTTTQLANIKVMRCGDKDPASYYTGGGSSLWGKTGTGYGDPCHLGQKWDPDGGKDMDFAVISGPAIDTNAPTPNPMTWETEPNALSATAITMTATAATDISEVEYFFHNVTDPNHDSDWQDSQTYVDVRLQPQTAYSYTVKARDKSAYLNETAYSTTASAETFIQGDLNHDNKVDFADFSVFALHWLEVDCLEPSSCYGADINLTGDVDFSDLGKLCENWLATQEE